MSEEIKKAQIEGANAYRLRISRNPYTKLPNDHSPEFLKVWNLKFRAWELGWSTEKKVNPHPEHKISTKRM